jgi:hypothetical protein
MKKTSLVVAVGLLLLFAAAGSASDTDGVSSKTTVWIGGHLVDNSDYYKKIGEYSSYDHNSTPEFGLTYQSITPNSVFYFDGFYFNPDNAFGIVSTNVADRFKGVFQYRSFTKQTGQDLLENIEAREWLSDHPGGKILTHELTDEGADYNFDRREVLSRISILLSEQDNLKLTVAHRAIFKEGSEQSIASTHCFSCHLTSESATISERTHHIEAGLDGEVGALDVGYKFAYRQFETDAHGNQAYWDEAVHPVNGSAGAEFDSRLNYSDESLAYGTKPKTEKVSHKIRVRGKAGKGRFSSALNMSRARNEMNNLETKSWAGVLNYAVMLSPTTRLVTKLSASGIDSDDPLIDLDPYRDGRTGVVTDFDFVRYSSLDRTTADFSAELFRRLSPNSSVSLLGGYDRVAREDYITVGDGLTTGTFTGQVKFRHRQGLKYNTSLKYRFEKISDPFVSSRDLFEANGSELLEPLLDSAGNPSNWYFYYQREALRYQAITTEPTDIHKIEWTTNYRPSSRTSMNLKVGASMDKNGDLDSLDVEHKKFNGNASFTFLPDSKWVFTGGANYRFERSRGPVAVALFDG